MQVVRRNLWISAILVGVALLVLGSVFIGQGIGARETIRSAMAEEEVTTSADASIPSAPVLDAQTAAAEEEILKEHTLGTYGPYTSMARDDPNRETYLKGLTLRNSLNLSILGFGVADMAIGTGAIVLLIGFTSMGLLAPALYAVRGTAAERAVAARRAAVLEAAPAGGGGAA